MKMMKNISIVLVFLLVFAAPSAVFAQSQSGGFFANWVEFISKTLRTPIEGYCPGAAGAINPTTPPTGDGSLKCADIPPELRKIFEDAAQQYGIDPALLAAIYGIGEHGNIFTVTASWPTDGPWACSDMGACGPFQFMPDTWDNYGVDGNGDGVADINNLQDAAASAANYLCATGACSGDFSSAINAYNNWDTYLNAVMDGYNKIKACVAGGT